MKVDVADALVGFARQPRGVEVVDRRDLAVAEVEAFERDVHLGRYAVAHAPVHQRGGFRAHRVVFDQRTRAEVPQLQGTRPRAEVVDRHCQRSHAFDGAGNAPAFRCAVAETRLREGDVGIDRQPIGGLVVVRQLEADPLARPAGFGGAGVTDEHQFGRQLQLVHRQRGLQARQRRSAQAQFEALGARQRRHAVDRITGLRIDLDDGAACVVAVKARTHVDVELGLGPRPEDQVELGADDAGAARAGVFGAVALHAEAIAVGAHAGHGAEGRCPARGVVEPQADAALLDVVAPCRRQRLPGLGVEQRVVDVVVLKLHANLVLAAVAEPARRPGMARIHRRHRAPVRLRELVAIDRVVEEVGEVGKQRQVPACDVGVDLRRRVAAAAPPRA